MLTHLLCATLADRFDEAHVGKLSPGSMAKVEARLRVALGLG